MIVPQVLVQVVGEDYAYKTLNLSPPVRENLYELIAIAQQTNHSSAWKFEAWDDWDVVILEAIFYPNDLFTFRDYCAGHDYLNDYRAVGVYTLIDQKYVMSYMYHDGKVSDFPVNGEMTIVDGKLKSFNGNLLELKN